MGMNVVMNIARGLLSSTKGLFSKIVSIVREGGEAQRRMDALRAAPDRFVSRPDAAPETYAEFLFRTSGPLQHEPSARARARAAARR
jgi:hypothetical protein